MFVLRLAPSQSPHSPAILLGPPGIFLEDPGEVSLEVHHVGLPEYCDVRALSSLPDVGQNLCLTLLSPWEIFAKNRILELRLE